MKTIQSCASCYEKESEIRRLTEQLSVSREALQEIVDVSSGLEQVSRDDTDGMAWVDKRARKALAA